MTSPKLAARPLLTLLAITVAVILVVPVFSVFFGALQSNNSETLLHLANTVLPEYISNTLWLCVMVGVGVLFGGVASAWLISVYQFPGKRFFEWALILPLAMPAYVLAYMYTDLLQYVGPVQSALRAWFSWTKEDYWFPDVRSLSGAALMFIFVLYPYVYVLARTAFLERAASMIEASRSLGLGPWSGFYRVSLPLARPAVVAGVALALMETLADFGTVSYFGVNTFTTGIYRAWFSLGDKPAAAQLASMLLMFVVTLLTLEQYSRRNMRYHQQHTQRHVAEQKLNGWRAFAATGLCALPIMLGFFIPIARLLWLGWVEGEQQSIERTLVLVRNSFTLASIAAALAVCIAVILLYAARSARSRLMVQLPRLVGLGYAVPGSVIAVGILIPVITLDHWLIELWQMISGHTMGLLLTGGVFALVYAYLVRFSAIALQAVGSSLSRITHNMDSAAMSLGLGRWQMLRRVHFPLLRRGMLTAGLLVFVDVMKELPATLVMRPFNFDTLATQTYILAADERLAEASIAALAIVCVGLLPLIALSRQISRKESGSVC